MVADQLVLAAKEHLVRVVVPEVLLVHEGQLDDVVERANVIRVDVRRLHAIVIELREGVELIHQGLEVPVLKGLQIGLGYLLDSGVPACHLFTWSARG